LEGQLDTNKFDSIVISNSESG